MTVLAPAKLNLRLRVLAREDSGYHQLETVFCALEFGDTLHVEATEGGGIRLEVAGAELGPAEDNLVYRAAAMFFEAAERRAGARIHLEKHIPAGAGLGGGSSDAAATLRALNRLHGDPLDTATLLEIGARLGSDIPFFLADTPLALAWGRGERMLALPPLPPAPVLIAAPGLAVSTPEAYRALDRHGGADNAGPAPSVTSLDALASWDAVASAAENDFEPVVFERYLELAEIRGALADTGARPALLTGSGSALFGVYADEDARARAAAVMRRRFPDLRLVETATRAT